MRTRHARPISLSLLAFLLCALSCQGRTQLVSPVVREDLRDRLPARLQQMALDHDGKYDFPCQVDVKLADSGASQELSVVWRVMGDGPDRYITAVSVEPNGPTSGANDPTASAVLGALSLETVGEAKVNVTSVTVSWQARNGCDKVGASREVALRADHASCRVPRAPAGLLKPVE